MFEPKYGDVSVKLDGNVATLEIHRPPHNFFDFNLIHDLADAFEALDQTPECRALMLCSEGKSFCAGANFANRDAQSGEAPARPGENPLYIEGVRLFRCKKPVVAAVQGSAIGGGFGLALVADFRVATADSRFAANFVKLGIHPGFGLTYTLPRLIGVQKASLMFYTGRRIDGKEALEWGLCDQLVEPDDLRNSALALAKEIAEGAPLALLSTRATMRQGLADAVKAQTDHEFKEQSRLFKTEDHREGVKAVSERRPGKFIGK
ncbi:enoyl-CoA hydratase/isomerase family protein [Candidatus Binatus sp.]|uniref:enoyl-CoA hydratase/isomerase family protein n=1 Tax=Candidatus Binatus sp. TaxID=2811406 RepID=UPI003C406A41